MRANRPQLCVDFGELPRQGPSRDWPPVRGENFRESVVSPGWEGVSDARWKELFANRTFHASDYQAGSSDRVARRTAPPPYVPVLRRHSLELVPACISGVMIPANMTRITSWS